MALLMRLIALVELVGRAVEIQPAAEGVIAACTLPGDTPPDIARYGGEIASQYHALYREAQELAAGADADSVQRRVVELLIYHGEMLHECLCLAFPTIRSPRSEARRLALNGLGTPARTLRDADSVLRLWIAEIDCSDRI